MKLPAPVSGDGLRKSAQVNFYGYDAMSTDGGIVDMQNMTSDYWPEMAARERRRKYMTLEEPGGLWAFGEMMWVDGTDFHYGDLTVADFITQAEADHTFAVLGDYVVCWPEKRWYDTVSGETGSLEASVSVANMVACFRSETSPEGLSTQANCLDLNWPGSITPYPGYEGDLREVFKPGDGIWISGCVKHKENNTSLIIREVTEHALYFYDDGLTLDAVEAYDVGAGGLPAGNYTIKANDIYYYFTTSRAYPAGSRIQAAENSGSLTVSIRYYENGADRTDGLTGSRTELSGAAELKTYTRWEDCYETGAVTVSRTVPEMDRIFYHGNRLYGYNGDTIYASALGDIFNWNVFDGLASDSWTSETGTAGRFTAGISYGGYARFFKENQIFTLYGDYPQEFALQGQELNGVEKGSGGSPVIVNGRLFYLSPQGPCVYTGGVPSLIGEKLGLTRYKNGVGGSDGKKYYLSMEDEEGAWHLFVFDTSHGMWIREDSLRVTGFAKYEKDIFALDADGNVWILGRPTAGDQTMEEETVAWYAEFGDITDGMPDRKRVTKLQIRLDMDSEAVVKVEILYDSEDAWSPVAHITAKRKQSVTLPIIPRRLDHFRLKISGWGGCRISSIARQSAAASAR